jgi:hypothetical protein
LHRFRDLLCLPSHTHLMSIRTGGGPTDQLAASTDHQSSYACMCSASFACTLATTHCTANLQLASDSHIIPVNKNKATRQLTLQLFRRRPAASLASAMLAACCQQAHSAAHSVT